MFLKCPCGVEVALEQWIDVSEFQIDPNLGFKSELCCVLSVEFHSVMQRLYNICAEKPLYAHFV